MSDTPKHSRLKTGIADVARVAHWMLDRSSGYTKREAALELARVARALNDAAPHQWTDEQLDTLLGNAIPAAHHEDVRR